MHGLKMPSPRSLEVMSELLDVISAVFGFFFAETWSYDSTVVSIHDTGIVLRVHVAHI